MKALNSVGAAVIEKIIAGRPYYSLKDFIKRCPLNKTAMISLIKAGAFDKLAESWAKELNIEPRQLVMIDYLSRVCEAKSKLTLQNFNGLIEKGLTPNDKNFNIIVKTYKLNKYFKKNKKGLYYLFKDKIAYDFYITVFDQDVLEVIQGIICIKQTDWDSMYSAEMDKAREWLKKNQEELLEKYNLILFKELWDKYAVGSISAWEMDALCFYYHDHELINVNNNKYGIVDFKNLSSVPQVANTFKRNGKLIPIYKISKIAGTVISKNDNRHSISLLTTTGVVSVKFTKDYYALFGRQISEVQSNGTKKVREKGWFTKGTKLLVQGYRRDDTFVGKTYKTTGGHQLYKITNVDGTDIELSHLRWGQKEDE